jgi:hypothetical protein
MKHPHKQKKIKTTKFQYDLEKRISTALLIYAGIFSNRYDVMEHMFFCIGNGYEWEKGELTDGTNFKSGKALKKYEENMLETSLLDNLNIRGRLTEDLFKGESDYINAQRKEIAEIYERIKQYGVVQVAIEENKKRTKEHRMEFILNSRRQEDGTLDPEDLEDLGFPFCVRISTYSYICNMPEDIKPEYLAAAKEIIQYIEDQKTVINNVELFNRTKERIYAMKVGS